MAIMIVGIKIEVPVLTSNRLIGMIKEIIEESIEKMTEMSHRELGIKYLSEVSIISLVRKSLSSIFLSLEKLRMLR